MVKRNLKLLIDNVTEVKKRRIINCAMVEFTEKGFDKASTNVIVRNAGISKGAIYQYFMKKEVMYYYLFDYAQTQVKNYLLDRVDLQNPDLINRIQSYMEQLLNLLNDYPYTLKFLCKAKNEENLNIKREIIKKKSDYIFKLKELIIKNIDRDLLNEDIDLDKIIFIIYSTLENLIDNSVKYNESTDILHNNLNEYFILFRKIFCTNN